MDYQLFVRNAGDDFVANVRMMLTDDIPCKFEGERSDGKLVVKTYSKDPVILSGKFGKSASMLPVAGFEKQLSDFGKYLKERNKAALIEYNGRLIYLLPAIAEKLPVLSFVYCVAPSRADTSNNSNSVIKSVSATSTDSRNNSNINNNNNNNHIGLGSAVLAGATAVAAGVPQSVSVSDVKQAPSSTASTKPAAAAGAFIASSSGAPKGKKSGGMLSSLMSSISSANVQFEAAARAGKVHKPVESKRERMNREVRVQVEQNLLGEANEAIKQLDLEPMDKEDRYFVHDIIADYPQLVSGSTGEFDERHVVIYKVGHEPPEFEPHFQNKTQATQFTRDVAGGSGRASAAAKRQAEKAAMQQQRAPVVVNSAAGATIVPVHLEKRDRRTMEMILEDRKKNKVQKTSEDDR